MKLSDIPRWARPSSGTLLGGLLLALASGCSREPSHRLEPELLPRIALLLPDPSPTPGPWSTLLHSITSSVPTFTSADLPLPPDHPSLNNRILIVADPPQLHAPARQGLAQTIAAGQPVLLCGRLPTALLDSPAFSAPPFTPLHHRHASREPARRLTQTPGQTVQTIPPLSFESPPALQPSPHLHWRPLFSARNTMDEHLGWPASLYISPPDETQPLRHYAWIGIDPDPTTTKIAWKLLNQTIRAIDTPVLLTQAGLSRHAVTQNEPLTIHASWLLKQPADPHQTLRVAVEFLNPRGQLARRVVSPPLPLDQALATLDAGRAPDPGNTPALYTLVISLRDPADSRTLDTTTHLLKIFPHAEIPDPPQPITTTGALLTEGRRPIFLLGLHYQPLTLPAPGRPPQPWLSPATFDGHAFLRDLRHLVSLGFNTLALSYTSPDQAPQLNWGLDELRNLNLRASLRIAGLDPLNPDYPLAQTLLQAIRPDLRSTIALVEADLAPLGFHASDIQRLLPAWEKYLIDRFGSLHQAHELLQPSPTHPIPSHHIDLKLLTLPDHPLATAYRMFLLDLVQHGHGQTRQLLQRNRFESLLTARSGALVPSPPDADTLLLDPALGSPLLDLIGITPPPILPPDIPTETLLTFSTRYARGISGGKPAIWLATLPEALPAPLPPAVLELHLDRAFQSEAAGWFYPTLHVIPWQHHPHSAGLLHPDGSLRTLATPIQAFKHRTRMERPPARPWRGHELPEATFLQDHPFIARQWFIDPRHEDAIRPPGFRAETEPLIRRHAHDLAREPRLFRLLHASWIAVTIDGQPAPVPLPETLEVRVNSILTWTLANVGLATWPSPATLSSSPLLLRAQHETGRSETLRFSGPSIGETTTVAWRPRQTGTWTLQPWIEDIAPMGSSRTINVLPAN